MNPKKEPAGAPAQQDEMDRLRDRIGALERVVVAIAGRMDGETHSMALDELRSRNRARRSGAGE